ncbi:hypothetical protein [Mycobacterium leprae]|uniref:hypothetical protein n=1 Tax=Mycobacterium leprae TaxID=1769 RepID=UPI00059B97EB|nr:hypothetical protein [Mycobacterium leprae]
MVIWMGHQQDWSWLHSVDSLLLNVAHNSRGGCGSGMMCLYDLVPVTLRVLGVAVALVLLVCLPPGDDR